MNAKPLTNAKRNHLVLTLGLPLTSLILAPLGGAEPATGGAEPFVSQPYTGQIEAILGDAGVALPPEARGHLEALGDLLDAGLDRLVAAGFRGDLPELIPVDIGVEACSGAGSCGGKYVDDGDTWNMYYLGGNYANASACDNTIGVWVVFSVYGDAKNCYAPAKNQVCWQGNCTEPPSTQVAQSSGGANPASLGQVDTTDVPSPPGSSSNSGDVLVTLKVERRPSR